MEYNLRVQKHLFYYSIICNFNKEKKASQYELITKLVYQ